MLNNRNTLFQFFCNFPNLNSQLLIFLHTSIQLTGTKADIILKAVNKYLMELAKEQIRIAFEQAEKEVQDLRQRTRAGIETAKINGKQIGQTSGSKLTTKKSL